MRVILILVAVGVAAAKPAASEQGDVLQSRQSSPSALTCGSHTLTEGTYTISSPAHPANYANNYDCAYSLTPAAGVDSFSVQCSAFDIESHSSCKYDWLQVGGIKYCGTAGPPSSAVIGATDIEFHTDDSVARPGFQCTITARSGSVPTELACGTHTLTTGLYSIKSPNYPANYGDNFDCAYTIMPDTGVNTMTLARCFFDIEANASCSWDWLEVNGVKYCGRQGPAVAENGAFNIAFHTDDSGVRPGYYCEITATV